ncbi:MAG: PilT/PilU family type 4a pilus ATPase [Proteobacteria bacterium]|nr:PilT/PilU family type 4a pilus ATPase [Pseudomonadota bacterium]
MEEFEQILKKATEKKASDVHLKVGLPPIVRVNGNLYYLNSSDSEKIARLSAEQLSQWALALMSPRQLEKFENGEEVDLGYESGEAGRYRINICYQRSNTRLVCRHIPAHIKTFEELNLPSVIEELASLPRGLILITGTTGSGKSTTLAAIIDYIAKNRSCHIITIEDPIEFSFKDRKSIVTQREVGLDTGGFTKALKYALRQDPDVILIGEMRDEETMRMALSAAETGHLVLSTLHTLDAVETINRIVGSVDGSLQEQMRHQLSATLNGVISQRLIRKKDGKGRIPALEILISNLRVKEMILDPSLTQDLRRAIEDGKHIGMQTFDQSLMDHYQKGLITEEEALLHCSNVQDFQLRLGGVVPGQWDEKSEGGSRKSRKEQIAEALKNKETDNEKIEVDLVEPKKAS